MQRHGIETKQTLGLSWIGAQEESWMNALCHKGVEGVAWLKSQDTKPLMKEGKKQTPF